MAPDPELRLAELIAALATLVEAGRASEITPIRLRFESLFVNDDVALRRVTVEDQPAYDRPTVVLSGD